MLWLRQWPSAIMQTAPVNAASSAVQTLAGGAVAMAYVSTALNKMDNSEQGQQEAWHVLRRKLVT